ncbi:MAG: glycosyltransferase [Planctomycetota bacterium]|jgi:glycosyltransferase involved in cell wall biosynthesis
MGRERVSAEGHTARELRLLHVITTLGVGGAEKHLLLLARGLAERGHAVRIAWLKGQGELAPAFAQAGLATERLGGAADAGGEVRPWAAKRALARLVREWRPDLVHTHLLKADALGALAVRGVPLVSSKHNDERALLRWPVSVVHGVLARRVARTIALSDHVAAFTARHGRVPAGRITRIYYGIDPAAWRPGRSREAVRAELGLADEAPVLICVGRLAPQKDHTTLLRAMTRVSPDGQLLVVGGDPFGDGEARLAAQVDELGLGGRVHLLGIRHDVPDLLAASDLFVLPSLWEGLGLVFLEAMAAGLPVVATRVSAVPEVVEHGVTGWLVPPADPEALAAAVGAALRDPRAREAAGRAGRERLAARFGLPRMIDETLAVYDGVLS